MRAGSRIPGPGMKARLILNDDVFSLRITVGELLQKTVA
jgi:hypothetical protein